MLPPLHRQSLEAFAAEFLFQCYVSDKHISAKHDHISLASASIKASQDCQTSASRCRRCVSDATELVKSMIHPKGSCRQRGLTIPGTSTRLLVALHGSTIPASRIECSWAHEMTILSRSAPGAAAGAQPLRIQHPDKRAVPLLVLLDGRQLIGQPVRTHLHTQHMLCSTALIPSCLSLDCISVPQAAVAHAAVGCDSYGLKSCRHSVRTPEMQRKLQYEQHMRHAASSAPQCG